ncbi:MAG: hypothetical protein HYV42_03015 [Candidatus Magasanikbacteria bacterium]|nr:hypothetical protein [Candidatus Magasanikbacteria bacterium]
MPPDKVVGKPPIYALNSRLELMYFPTGDEFKSWNADDRYGNYTRITQVCFNSIPAPRAFPAGVSFRPGTFLVKPQGRTALYAVLPNYTLAKITPGVAAALYGPNYRVMAVAETVWGNYVNRAPDITAATPHAGMLVQSGGKTWYVDVNNTLREVTSGGLTSNRFRRAWVREVSSETMSGWATGAVIDQELNEISRRISL